MLLTTSCSTKKNKWNRRVYHNLTGHYNAYFNGNEALKVAVNDIATSNIDDYSEVLKVFPLGTPETATTAFTNLDRSIMKASIVIHKHSMFYKKREQVKWVYYSYLMMAKARFYKHEYGISKQVLKYVTTKYAKENVRFDAMLWLALIASIEENYEDATSLLDAINSKVSSGVVSKESYRILPMVYADVFLRQNNYEAAIPHLKKAIDRSNKKKIKARLYFILAQAEQREGKLDLAVQHYLQVLKKSPTYAMDFNARMNMAKCYNGGDSKTVIKQLNKMLKDIKNEEFQDQIYFVLAEIALKEKNKPQAIDYLKLSVSKSVSNNKQKAFSALKLAEIFFEDQKYPNAQAYYDSTIMFLPKDYVDYEKLNWRKNVLTELVSNLIIIQREDSLQALANMSESQRLKVIDQIIADEIEAERQRAEAERERLATLQFMEENRQAENQLQSVTQKSNNAWYFYNSNSVKTGFAEFGAIWGKRKLTDNWRLSDKEVIGFGSEGGDELSEEEKDQEQSKTRSSKKTREYYLQDIPLTQKAKDSSDVMIENALFASGIIYKEKLQNNPKAMESFDELLRRFPMGRHSDQTYYNLYRIYMLEGNNSDARFYKKKLLKEYPESDYAKILQDPDYFKKLQEAADKVKIIYKETYQLFVAKQYVKVQENCAKAKIDYPNNKIELARFEMLNALCVGTKKDTIAFIAALQVVVDDYPDSDVKPRAEDMIAQLKVQTKKEKEDAKEDDKASDEEDGPKTIFVYNPEEVHLFLVLADKRNVKISELKNRLSDHNSKYYGTNNLTVSAIPINENILLLGVSNFPDQTKALEYFKSARRNSLLYVMLKKNGGDYFVISEGNYSRLYKSKDLDGYRKFYSKKYPEGK